MTTEQNFLITYGLHNFVSFAQLGRKRIFTIQGEDNQKMINHAKSLIQGNYGNSTHVHVN